MRYRIMQTGGTLLHAVLISLAGANMTNHHIGQSSGINYWKVLQNTQNEFENETDVFVFGIAKEKENKKVWLEFGVGKNV